MSWLVDFAGKAEDFLNKIDKNAAVALNTPTSTKNEKESRPKKSEPFIEPSEGESNRNFRTINNAENSTVVSTSTDNNISTVNSSSSSFSKSKSNKKQSRTQSHAKAPKNSEPVSASSSKAKENAGLANNASLIQNGFEKKPSASTKNISSSSTVKDVASEEDLIAYLNSSDPTEGINESLILKDEVETEAKELKLLTKNHRKLQKEYDELKQKLEVFQEKLTNAESARHSNEAEERDLRKLLEERDSEIRGISSRHQQALEALQKLEVSQDSLQKHEQCLLENAQLKSENENLHQRTELFSSQVETAENHVLSMKSTLSSMEKEFTNYKEKAKSILNYKDELIASLKSDSSPRPHGDASSNPADELLAEITALKNERELLQADISQTRAIVDSLKDDNSRLEKEVSTLRCYTEDLGGQLRLEKETVASLQSENLQVCQQLTSLQFELEREKNERKKSEELVTQYKQASNRNNNNHASDRMSQNNGHVVGSNADDREVSKLKTRVSALSQSLYEKQSLINDLSTDKQLLQIEVERLRNDLRESMVESNNEFCHSGLPQTVIASQPLYLSESPWDSRVSARMKRIYTQLDSVFCQFGLALRKRPNLRLGMSLYVIFLHLWVFFVLFSWMHHATPDPE